MASDGGSGDGSGFGVHREEMTRSPPSLDPQEHDLSHERPQLLSRLIQAVTAWSSGLPPPRSSQRGGLG